MPSEITGERLTSLFRPRSVALVGASDKSTFSMLAYRNLVEFGFGAHTYLVNRRGVDTHGRPTVTSCAQIGEPVDVAYLMVPQPGMLAAAWWSDATRAGRAAAPGAVIAVPAADERHGRWSEDAARRMLSEAGIPVAPAWLATSADDAVKAAAEIGGRLAVKLVSPEILHKSDIGGVLLDVPADEDAIRDAYQAVTAAAAAVEGASVDGVLISPMRGGGTELLVGVVRDPHWGPMLAVALGGIFVEVLADSALAPLPITPAQAGSLLERLRGAPVLRGGHGAAPADLTALAAVIARVGDLAVALGDDLESLEVNPLRVDGDTIEALDAFVTWTPKGHN